MLIRPPPPPTLFPYTTLFRSADALPGIDTRIAGGRLADGVAEGAIGVLHEIGRDRHPGPGPGGQSFLGQVDLGEGKDRKSTRLNSSHVKISYAVFCLKKKTRN